MTDSILFQLIPSIPRKNQNAHSKFPVENIIKEENMLHLWYDWKKILQSWLNWLGVLPSWLTFMWKSGHERMSIKYEKKSLGHVNRGVQTSYMEWSLSCAGLIPCEECGQMYIKILREILKRSIQQVFIVDFKNLSLWETIIFLLFLEFSYKS